MKISKEIKSLRNRIEPLIEDHVSWLYIGLEYCPESKCWFATPCYEGGGDGSPSYIDNPLACKGASVLQGMGGNLPAAIKDLKQMISKIEEKDLPLYKW